MTTQAPLRRSKELVQMYLEEDLLKPLDVFCYVLLWGVLDKEETLTNAADLAKKLNGKLNPRTITRHILALEKANLLSRELIEGETLWKLRISKPVHPPCTVDDTPPCTVDDRGSQKVKKTDTCGTAPQNEKSGMPVALKDPDLKNPDLKTKIPPKPPQPQTTISQPGSAARGVVGFGDHPLWAEFETAWEISWPAKGGWVQDYLAAKREIDPSTISIELKHPPQEIHNPAAWFIRTQAFVNRQTGKWRLKKHATRQKVVLPAPFRAEDHKQPRTPKAVLDLFFASSEEALAKVQPHRSEKELRQQAQQQATGEQHADPGQPEPQEEATPSQRDRRDGRDWDDPATIRGFCHSGALVDKLQSVLQGRAQNHLPGHEGVGSDQETP